MKSKRNPRFLPPRPPAPPDPTTDPAPIPDLPPPQLIPIPTTFSDTQPLPGVSLDTESLLRDLLENRLPPAVLKKL